MSTFITTTSLTNIPAGSTVTKILGENNFFHAATGTIVSSNVVREVNEDTATTVVATPVETLSVNRVLFELELDDDISAGEIAYGSGYRSYTVATNRWDYFTFEKTSTDIGRMVSGFALPCPSSKQEKIDRLRILNSIYNLNLTEAKILESVNN